MDTPNLLATLAVALAALSRADHVDRQVGAMGTTLALSVEACDRASALAASETAVRAIEAVERRLSTWREDSELSRLNRAAVGSELELSVETARDLGAALRWTHATEGAFDPAVGALVDAWDLRGAGRIPSDVELRTAIVPGGLAAALVLDARHAQRIDARLRIEEGGFGKGVGLDAALQALAGSAARAQLDFGGQVAVLGDGKPFTLFVSDPRDRSRAVVSWRIESGSISTSGNSEHALDVGGVRVGHILDPRTGRPARDFGSVSVWAANATDADCASTALFVMGPDAALAWSEARGDLDLLVLEFDGPRLRARATSRLRERLTPLVADLDLSFVPPSARR